LAFGNQSVGTTSPAQAVTVTNAGSASVSISGIGITGDFAQTNSCGTIGAHTSCSISVTFTPTGPGQTTGTMTLTGNTTNGFPTTVINLSGKGNMGKKH
jgi:Abnormal spindle-like microcephaly-assoc'd, ASPM-SPD-2-Hydin